MTFEGEARSGLGTRTESHPSSPETHNLKSALKLEGKNLRLHMVGDHHNPTLKDFSQFNIYAFRVGLGAGEGRGPVSLLLDDDDDKSLSHLEKSCSRVDIFSDVLTP